MGIPVKLDGNQLCYKNGLEFHILKFLVFLKKLAFRFLKNIAVKTFTMQKTKFLSRSFLKKSWDTICLPK